MARSEAYCPICDQLMRKVGSDNFVCPSHPDGVPAPKPKPKKKATRKTKAS